MSDSIIDEGTPLNCPNSVAPLSCPKRYVEINMILVNDVRSYIDSNLYCPLRDLFELGGVEVYLSHVIGSRVEVATRLELSYFRFTRSCWRPCPYRNFWIKVLLSCC